MNEPIESGKTALWLKFLEMTTATDDANIRLCPNKYGGSVEIRISSHIMQGELSAGQLVISPKGKFGVCVGHSIGHRGQLVPWFYFENEDEIVYFPSKKINHLQKTGIQLDSILEIKEFS